jgi:hypothetical protein
MEAPNVYLRGPPETRMFGDREWQPG